MQILRAPFLLLAIAFMAGCATTPSGIQSARLAMYETIRQEPPGNYFVGRRFYKEDYKFWGYVREPRQPWSTAKLVMLNEQQKLAPDRAQGNLGIDNGYEYKLFGRYTGETVYEPASNGFYPEFRLTGYELMSSTPASIFRSRLSTDPSTRYLERPF